MSLRARLTIWSVLLMAVIVGVVSAVDLAQEIDHQFQADLDRAKLYEKAAVDAVTRIVNSHRRIPIRLALESDPDLSGELLNVMTASQSLNEVAVCDLQGIILAHSESKRAGTMFPAYPDFQKLVDGTLREKAQVLFAGSQKKYYRLSQPLGVQGQPEIYVRVAV